MHVTTTRLYIRDLREDDWQAMHELRTDHRVYRFNHFGPETEDATRTWVVETIKHNNRLPRLSHNCAIVLQATNQVIGWIGFGVPDETKAVQGNIDFGYALLPAWWHHGYMTEALGALLAFVFTTTRAECIFGECNVGNIGSARVMEKAGMRRVAHYQNQDETAPDKLESYRYEIERSMWEKGQAKG